MLTSLREKLPTTNNFSMDNLIGAYVFEHAMSDLGFTGFFPAHPQGYFTIGRDGVAWVVNDMLGVRGTLHADEWFGAEPDVAHSALIQGF